MTHKLQVLFTILWGSCAGVLVFLTVALGVYVVFTGFSFIFLLLGDLSRSASTLAPTDSAMLLHSTTVLDSWQGFLAAIWRGRLALVSAVVLGGTAAWAYGIGRLVHGKWAWPLSYVSVAIGLTIPAIVWLVVQRAEIALLAAEQPQSFAWRRQASSSYGLELGLALIFALPLAYGFWAIWRWWFWRLYHRLQLPSGKQQMPGHAALGRFSLAGFTEISEGHQSLARVKGINRRLLLPLIVLLLLSLAALPPVNQLHERASVKVQYGATRLDALSQPRQELALVLQENARSFTIVKRVGAGTATLSLRSSDKSDKILREIKEWSFGPNDPDLYQRLALTDLLPGHYTLLFEQISGVGFFEYTISHGGGQGSNLAALGIGLLLALAVVCAGLLLLLGAVRFSLI